MWLKLARVQRLSACCWLHVLAVRHRHANELGKYQSRGKHNCRIMARRRKGGGRSTVCSAGVLAALWRRHLVGGPTSPPTLRASAHHSASLPDLVARRPSLHTAPRLRTNNSQLAAMPPKSPAKKQKQSAKQARQPLAVGRARGEAGTRELSPPRSPSSAAWGLGGLASIPGELGCACARCGARGRAPATGAVARRRWPRAVGCHPPALHACTGLDTQVLPFLFLSPSRQATQLQIPLCPVFRVPASNAPRAPATLLTQTPRPSSKAGGQAHRERQEDCQGDQEGGGQAGQEGGKGG